MKRRSGIHCRSAAISKENSVYLARSIGFRREQRSESLKRGSAGAKTLLLLEIPRTRPFLAFMSRAEDAP